jgi:hypothetical protein
MIAPTKHITLDDSLLGVGATVLRELRGPKTLTALWERCRVVPSVGNYHRFVLALDLLYALGAVEMTGAILARSTE